MFRLFEKLNNPLACTQHFARKGKKCATLKKLNNSSYLTEQRENAQRQA